MSLAGAYSQSGELYTKGLELEEENKLEEAFEAYRRAAEAGNADAMWAIAKLYLNKDFRKVQVSNLPQLMLQGGPVFPWNVVEREEIDYESVLKWSRKAADHGNAKGAYAAGVFLCEGIGCAPDVRGGLPYLETAMKQGVQGAQEMYYLYKPADAATISDAEYERKLSAFVRAADEKDKERYRLFSELKGGTPKQLARLGYALMAAKNLHKPGYSDFPDRKADNGIAYFPAAPKRVGWETLIRFDRNAFPEGARILFTSDIDVRPDFLHGLSFAGTAEYTSPAFGWLEEGKKAYVFKFDAANRLTAQRLEKTVQHFRLAQPEYQPDHVAFFVEDGEKEYSVEICALVDGRIDILYRYTIGGSERVYTYFEPKLLKLSYVET